MNTKDFDTREAIISSGRQEFLTNGFEKASLRTICKNAQVTTGAFYSYFSKKEDLFSAIVDPMLKDYYQMYSRVLQNALADIWSIERNEVEAIEFILAHQDGFRLLFDCSAGTKYEGFREDLIYETILKSIADEALLIPLVFKNETSVWNADVIADYTYYYDPGYTLVQNIRLK